jgi:hypothetical protein
MAALLEPPRSTIHTIVGPQSLSELQPGLQITPRRATQTLPFPRCSQVVPPATKQVPAHAVVLRQSPHSRSAVHGGAVVVVVDDVDVLVSA